MSSHGYSSDCPECGGKGTLLCATETRPHDMVEGTCVHCGYHYFTTHKKLSRKALKELQEGEGYDPKTKTFKEQ